MPRDLTDRNIGFRQGQAGLEQIAHLAKQCHLPGSLLQLVYPRSQLLVGLLQCFLSGPSMGDVLDRTLVVQDGPAGIAHGTTGFGHPDPGSVLAVNLIFEFSYDAVLVEGLLKLPAALRFDVVLFFNVRTFRYQLLRRRITENPRQCRVRHKKSPGRSALKNTLNRIQENIAILPLQRFELFDLMAQRLHLLHQLLLLGFFVHSLFFIGKAHGIVRALEWKR